MEAASNSTLCSAPISAVLPSHLSQHGAQDSHGRGEAAAAVSRAIVGLLRTRTGRGPTKARAAVFSHLATVALEGYRTAAETTLAAEGHSALAAQVRTALHDGMRSDAVAAIEAITRKRVSAYLTDHRDDRDLAVIAFHGEDSDLSGP